jgi:hypothetical protein
VNGISEARRMTHPSIHGFRATAERPALEIEQTVQ